MTSSETAPRRAKRRRLGGRQQRQIARRSGGASGVVHSGLQGGRYRPLEESQVQSIIDCALDVLADVGMGDPPPEVTAQALRHGALLDENGRLRLPRRLVERIIAETPKEFTLHGRDRIHDLEVNTSRVHLGTLGLAVKMVDPMTGTHRPSTLTDLYDFGRLVDAHEHIHYFSRSVTATDVTDLHAYDMSVMHACLTSTSKHVFTGFMKADHVQDGIELLDMVAGGTGEFAKAPFITTIVCPIVSPLRFGEDNTLVAIEAARAGIPVVPVIAGQAGATAPASLANALIQNLAETLAGLVLVQLFVPGHPVLVGSWPFVSDLRTGAFSGGSGEQALLMSASAQITNSLGLPSSLSAGMTDAKIPDCQAGFEKAVTVELAALAGGNMINASAGIYGSIMTAAFEGVVIDNDMFGNVLRTIRGIEVADAKGSLDIIRQVVAGDGHYLGDPNTLKLMETEYLYPDVSDRTASAEWESRGAHDIRHSARQRTNTILDTHYPMNLDAEIDGAIRRRFPIHLPTMDDLRARAFE